MKNDIERLTILIILVVLSAFFVAGIKTEDESSPANMIETQTIDNLPNKEELININGRMAACLHMNGFYSDMGLYVTNDKYIMSASPETSTDYEYDQIMGLKQFCDSKGINLLYVNQPTKYLDDSTFNQFATESFSNRNADKFMSRIFEAGINAIDLRKNMKEEGMNVRDMFYRTDHHWTTKTALWAASKIADALNEYCGYSIDTSIYNESNYRCTTCKEAWLGEQGKKLALSYVGLDDFTVMVPSFETSYTVRMEDGSYKEGTFAECFLNPSEYDLEKNVYEVPSWNYYYMQRDAVNNKADYGKVLFVDDSYAQTTEPFLSLGIHDTDFVIIRDTGESVRDILSSGDYDTVVIMYAQFMIGAHDDEHSSNREMFNFE